MLRHTPDERYEQEVTTMGRSRTRTGIVVMAGMGLIAAAPTAAGATGLGAGRLVPSVAALVGLVGVVLGGLALVRSARRIGTRTVRRGAVAAGVAGLTSLVVGGLHAANAAGGIGTGSGLAGAIVAIGLGVVSMVLGGLALARFRRAADRLPG
jgi:hypothetical protein